MNKTITSYVLCGHPFTSQDIFDRSSGIGIEGVQGNTVQVADIATTSVRNVLGERYNSVRALAHSTKVNRNSAFSPWYLDNVGGNIIQSIDIGKLGDFACYNHNAPTAETIITNTDENGKLTAYYNISITGCDTFGITAKVVLGEHDYESLIGQVTRVGLTVEDANGVAYTTMVDVSETSFSNGYVYYTMSADVNPYGTPDDDGDYFGLNYTVKPALETISGTYNLPFLDTSVVVDLIHANDNAILLFNDPTEWIEDAGSGCQAFAPEWDATSPPSASVNTGGVWGISNLVVVLDDGSTVAWSTSRANIYWSYKGSEPDLLASVDLADSPLELNGSGLPEHVTTDCNVYTFIITPTNDCY